MFEFISDRPALDFVPTLAERGTTDDESLLTPEDWVAWAAESGIVDDIARSSEEELLHVRAVRDAIFRVIAALIDGRSPNRSDLRAVNAAAARPGPVLRVDQAGRLHRTGGTSALLSALASDCLDLFDSPDRAQLHWCAGARCTRPFVDRSRGHRRRWCGMKGCGDRAKAAAFRQRKAAR